MHPLQIEKLVGLEPLLSLDFSSLYSPPQVVRIWTWVHYKKISMYRIFYLLQGDYSSLQL